MLLEKFIDNGHLLYFILMKCFTVYNKKPIMYTCCLTRECDVKEATAYNNQYKSIYTISTIQNRYTPKAPYEFEGPCIVIYSYNESQRDALFLIFIC